MVPVLPPVSVTGPLKAVFIQAPLALKHLVLLTVWISQVKKFCFVLFCYFLNDLNKKNRRDNQCLELKTKSVQTTISLEI